MIEYRIGGHPEGVPLLVVFRYEVLRLKEQRWTSGGVGNTALLVTEEQCPFFSLVSKTDLTLLLGHPILFLPSCFSKGKLPFFDSFDGTQPTSSIPHCKHV